MSERDGWNHLYLYDAGTGEVKNQITKGPMGRARCRAGRRAEAADLVSSRRHPPRTGSLLRPLLPRELRRHRPDGAHRGRRHASCRVLARSAIPDRHWSRVDQPPVTELRRVDDGRLGLCSSKRPIRSALLETGWQVPERFVAKGGDGRPTSTASSSGRPTSTRRGSIR